MAGSTSLGAPLRVAVGELADRGAEVHGPHLRSGVRARRGAGRGAA